jgi:hypothetical protein
VCASSFLNLMRVRRVCSPSFEKFDVSNYRINSGIRDTSVLGDGAVFFVFFNSWPIIL